LNQQLPHLPQGFEYRLDLRFHVTPRLLKEQPVHRWFYFPHSFSPQLIDEIIKEYNLQPVAKLLDPFVGAGTTLLRAKQLGFSATGSDLSPLSIFVTRAKIRDYDKEKLAQTLQTLIRHTPTPVAFPNKYPERLKKAFTIGEFINLSKLQLQINSLEENQRLFFLLALLKVQQLLSRAVPDGGWFRWVEKPDRDKQVFSLFEQQVRRQLVELENHQPNGTGEWKIHQLDARKINELFGTYDGLITSPPYPNRHDYSRIFHIELLSLGLSEKDVFALRHNSIRSHVEARKPVNKPNVFQTPKLLMQCLDSLPEDADSRIAPMLSGYFEDMFMCLKSAYDVLNPGSPCVFVVGNVRHAGVSVPVDEILVDVGKQVGFRFDKGWVARLRGNSAQQMGRFGREPSRETILIFRK